MMNILHADAEQDGLKMINIRAFIDSMKLTWLKRFISSTGDWTEIARTQLPPRISTSYLRQRKTKSDEKQNHKLILF